MIQVSSLADLRMTLTKAAVGVRVIIARCAPRSVEAQLVRTLQAMVDASLA